jgi:putative ABC transport system ATP-binding protein
VACATGGVVTAGATASGAGDGDHPLLEVRSVGRRVEERWILRGVGFTLRRGERLALTGPTGSGKTLLLRSIAGLDGFDEGQVVFGGAPLSRWAMPRYRARVRYLAQQPVMVEGTVEANLRVPFGLRVHRERGFSRERALEQLQRLERSEAFLRQDAASLSGGERQLVALVRTLLAAPQLLLLDEPSAALDDSSVRALERLVAAWLAEDGTRAVIWTSHQESQLERVTDRRVGLAPGSAASRAEPGAAAGGIGA